MQILTTQLCNKKYREKDKTANPKRSLKYRENIVAQEKNITKLNWGKVQRSRFGVWSMLSWWSLCGTYNIIEHRYIKFTLMTIDDDVK